MKKPMSNLEEKTFSRTRSFIKKFSDKTKNFPRRLKGASIKAAQKTIPYIAGTTGFSAMAAKSFFWTYQINETIKSYSTEIQTLIDTTGYDTISTGSMIASTSVGLALSCIVAKGSYDLTLDIQDRITELADPHKYYK